MSIPSSLREKDSAERGAYHRMWHGGCPIPKSVEGGCSSQLLSCLTILSEYKWVPFGLCNFEVQLQIYTNVPNLPPSKTFFHKRTDEKNG